MKSFLMRSVITRLLGVLIVVAVLHFSSIAKARNAAQPKREVHALWAHPPAVGKTPEAIKQFVDQCKRANIDTIVILVKGSAGEIYWQSKRFPQAIAAGYADFDFLGTLVKESHAQGIKVDAWLCDFIESPKGAAYREHPEWAQLNPDGTTTASEKLGHTRPYDYVWMCPSRRPGYVDQWLIPMFEEVAKNYQVDSVHHDYVRYPGDVAPDSYCFCDYCLAHFPQFAMLSYQSRPDERYRVKFAQPRIEANWWSDPTMLPGDWDKMDRRDKADFILNGRTIPGGPPDMRYFFYEYRQEQIKNYVRELATHIRSLPRKVEISAAVFKNPILSSRFIGQHWNEWTDWIDVYMPMTYRSHFAGSFESYLDHLTEVTERQVEWVHHKRPIYAGIATTYLYREELQPVEDMRERLNELKTLAADDAQARAEKAKAIRANFEALKPHLTEVAPQVSSEFQPLVDAVVANNGAGATPANVDALIARVSRFRSDLPPGYFQPDKLLKSIEAARKAHPEGIAIFAAGNLKIEKLWPTLETAFKR